jgi:flagellar protein FliS
MSETATASQEYLKSTVLTARPEQLQIMLLDGAIRFALKGREAIEANDHEQVFNNLDRAQRICLQLGAGLNRDNNPSIVDEMRAIYHFCYMRLIDASLHREVEAVDEVVPVLRHQRETWQILADKVASVAQAAANPAAAAIPAPVSAHPEIPAVSVPV